METREYLVKSCRTIRRYTTAMEKTYKKYNSYIFTGDKKSCSGCGACASVCAKKALRMQPDEEGFLYPVLDADNCIQCGLCDSRCPEVNEQSNIEVEQHCYIATTNRKDYYKESASIGICTMLSDYVIKKGGIVYGAFLDESDWTVYHVGVSDKEGLQKIRNSKYVQSNTRETFHEVKKHLINGKLILYIGTPCQIAGLKAYLHKDYENLYTIDLICHGVMSPKLLPLEATYWENLFNSKISNFRFRSKRVFKRVNPGMVNFDITVNGRKKHIERYAASSPSYHCFAYSGDGYNHNLRPICYQCPFRSQMRYADITVGDPWMISDQIIKDPLLKTRNVIRSLYSINSAKGNKLIRHINHMLHQLEFSFDDSFVQSAVRYGNREIPPTRSQIYSRIKNEEYGFMVESLFNCNLEREHKKFVRSYRLSYLKFIVKCIIGYNRWKK